MLTTKIFKVDNLAVGCYTVIVFNRKHTGRIQEGDRGHETGAAYDAGKNTF